MRADSNVYPLGTALAATGAGVPIRGGNYAFLANGAPGGGTISLQIQMPDASWCDVGAYGGNSIVKNTTMPYTATEIYLPACNVRCALTGATSPSINAWLAGWHRLIPNTSCTKATT